MKCFLLPLSLVLLAPALFAQTSSEKDAKSKFPPLDATVLDPALFTKKLEDIMAVYHKDVSASEKAFQERVRERMKKEGVDMPESDPSGFQWLSSLKDGMRADPKLLDLMNQRVGEVIIRAGAPGLVGSVTVSLYNRGDDGEISPRKLQEEMQAWKGRINTAVGTQAEARDQRGTVNTTGWMWRKNRVAWLLEASVSKGDEGLRAEFLRLRIASLDAPSGGSQPTRRSALTEHVKKTAEGDVYLDGVPMVDQGQKGYCAVASAERVVRYYGLDVDQHEMAQIANTSEMGTSMEEMEAALKSATGKLHVKTTKHFDLDERQFNADVKAYNQEAKKAGENEFKVEEGYVLNPMYFWQKAKPEIFRNVKAKQAGFDRFTGKIEEYINQGIPVCWALQLGMFKEEGLPQSQGGHMRLILGYNKTTKDILYSDSWGKGHEMKRMPAANAWCMTMALYTMAPTK